MSNKIKINRFERSIPTDTEGFVKTNDNGSALDIISSASLSEQLQIPTGIKGLSIKIENNQLTIRKGFTTCDTICDYYLNNTANNSQTLQIKQPIWDITSTYQFQPMILNVNNYTVRYSSMLYNTNGQGGLDKSSGTVLKHFLCHIKNFSGEFDYLISSYADTPLLNDEDTLLYFVKLEVGYHLAKTNDTKFVELDTDLTITIPIIVAGTTYEIFLDSVKNVYVVAKGNYNNFYNNQLVIKKIGEFTTVSDSTNIVRYYPMIDLAESYQNRYIILEQIGSTGYRLYSDGWKEQWGTLANPVFPIAFNEIPLNVVRGATNVTRTGMTIAAGYWFAKGY